MSGTLTDDLMRPNTPSSDEQSDSAEGDDTDSDNSVDDKLFDNLKVDSHGSNFLFMSVVIGNMKVSALLDTGSSINLISKYLYDRIPGSCKSLIDTNLQSLITLANNSQVNVEGQCHVKVKLGKYGEKHRIPVYVISETSHPFILGTEFMNAKKITLNFADRQVSSTSCTVKCVKAVDVLPNSETLIWGKVSEKLAFGAQGFCEGKTSDKSSLLVCKALVSVTVDHKVPIKILNPSNSIVSIPRGKTVAKLSLLDSSFHVLACNVGEMQQNSSKPKCAHVVMQKECSTNSCGDENIHSVDTGKCNMHVSHCNSQPDTSVKDESRLQDHSSNPQPRLQVENEISLSEGSHNDMNLFLDNFMLENDNLSSEEIGVLSQFLYSNKDLFVTKENPSLGYTTLVQHQIQLKKDARSCHQRAHRLSPEKKVVLRHQLDELLQQGIIAPVSDNENVPITSPMLLVSKVNKKGKRPSGPTISKEEALRSYRFCCDFRYLNSQLEEFRYTIPDLQDLTESFTARTPNYMTSIDLSSGFFQMGIAEDSTRYTAFNTCFGTYKFLRLPMGLRTSPSTFQLLMDKVLHGLTFESALCYLDDVLICSETFEQRMSGIEF